MQTARKDSVAEMLVGRANGSGGAGDVEIGMCTTWIGEFETFETEEHTGAKCMENVGRAAALPGLSKKVRTGLE